MSLGFTDFALDSPWNGSLNIFSPDIEGSDENEGELGGQIPDWEKYLTGMIWSSDVWTLVAEILAKERSVVEIWGTVDSVSYYVLTIIDKFDRNARRRVYALQREILEMYSVYLTFDFNVMALDGRDSSEMISDLKCLFHR